MSTKQACPTDTNPCAQPYPVKDYFLAMFIAVVSLICLRILLYAGYYAWKNFLTSRRHLSSSVGSPSPENQGHCPSPEDSTSVSTASVVSEPVVIVIVPGKDQPTFVARPDPLSSYKDSDIHIVPSKSLDIPMKGG
ncbi:hypothetical protein KP509_08G055300 [Ceratopteris richardii]|nr:hypothetical protein KP509_08G055300 [Ceratopteris richardii]